MNKIRIQRRRGREERKSWSERLKAREMDTIISLLVSRLSAVRSAVSSVEKKGSVSALNHGLKDV